MNQHRHCAGDDCAEHPAQINPPASFDFHQKIKMSGARRMARETGLEASSI
jgi:hypothetical protein